jgi:hypothetical protein
LNNASASQSDGWAHPDKKLQPKMRLFISFDVIDSTAIKRKERDKELHRSAWAEHFSDFLTETPVLYASCYEKVMKELCPVKECRKSLGTCCLYKKSRKYHRVKVWKYIGDEVVLTTELTCREQPLLHLFAVRDAVHELNKKFSERGAISCKACVWTAGFPVGNIEVAFPEYQERKRKVRDYLGASVDFGFRLAKYSKRERIAVGHSMLALLETFRVGEETLKLYSGGPVELKGIDERYPLFWMATPAFIDDGKEYPHEVENPDALKKFLGERFFKDKPWPFIPEEGKFGDCYKELFGKAVKFQESLKYSVYAKQQDGTDEKAKQQDSADEKAKQQSHKQQMLKTNEEWAGQKLATEQDEQSEQK